MKNNAPSPTIIALSETLRAHKESVSQLLPGSDCGKYTALLLIEGVSPFDLGAYRYAFGHCECHAEVANRVLEEHQANQRPLPAEYAIMVHGQCAEQHCTCGGQGRTITYFSFPTTDCGDTVN